MMPAMRPPSATTSGSSHQRSASPPMGTAPSPAGLEGVKPTRVPMKKLVAHSSAQKKTAAPVPATRPMMAPSTTHLRR